ncbi:RING finger protein [Quillaja saponaria]|uniref:RING-type E3 ubiquitin transferase n=1 Tax=Quillaja saponaria TaxID=32244 RepID=A0AAD7QEQ0_QUISA|nr:RING finger protein [Quillaja saponaria]
MGGLQFALLLVQTALLSPPYVAHQNAKKVRNDVNVQKDTLRVEEDENNPDHQLVSFFFDALYDGSITISYFAKEEAEYRSTPLFPEAFQPVRFPYQKGVGQKFCQPSGTGIDLASLSWMISQNPHLERMSLPLYLVAVGFDDSDTRKECIICITEPKDTAVLPCRHMCMCSECAKTLRLQSNK